MISEKAKALFAQPLIARLATLAPDGYPHVVPLWFALDGEEIVIISERKTRHVEHLLATPRAALTVGGEPNVSGYMLQGDVTISDDVDHVWTNRMTYRYETKEDADRLVVEWADLDMVVIRIKVTKISKVA